MKSQHSAYIVKVTPGQFLEMSDHFKSVRALCPGIVTESTVVMTIPSFTPESKEIGGGGGGGWSFSPLNSGRGGGWLEMITCSPFLLSQQLFPPVWDS